MGRAGDCGICFSPKRAAIEAARAEGMSYADLSRVYGPPETSIRRHFVREHVLPKAKPKPRPVRPPTPRHPKPEDPDPEVSFQKVKQAAVLLGVPFGELASCLTNHLEMTIVTASDAEEEELLDGYGAAEDCDEYMAAVVRVRKFYAETA